MEVSGGLWKSWTISVHKFLTSFVGPNKFHLVEPLIAPILDFVWPSPWLSKPELFSHLHFYLHAHGEPKSRI